MGKKKVFVIFFLFVLSCISFGMEISMYDGDKKYSYFKVTLQPEDLDGKSSMSLIAAADENFMGVYVTPTKLFTERSESGKKECWKNLRIIRGAIEMYNMDHTEVISKLEPGTLELLTKDNYLRSIPTPPSTKCKYESSGDLSKDGILRCTIHGSFDDSDNTSSEMTAPKLSSEKIGLVILGRMLKGKSGSIRIIDKFDGKELMRISLPSTKVVSEGERLKEEWEAIMKDSLKKWGALTPGESVFSYILRQWDCKKQFGSISPLSETTFQTRPNNIDLYSLTTGALAIQETLQFDRMTNINSKVEPLTQDIKLLKGPQIQSHPFATMLGRNNPQTYPIEDLVPVYFYSFHFSNINKQIAFSDLLDQWGSMLLQMMRVSAKDARLKEKYLEQLCLETSELTRLFGDKVIDDLVICGSDPFLDDGTDLSVIFSVKNFALFEMNCSRYFAKAKSNFPDIKEEKLEIEGVSVYSLTTPDRRVHSYSCNFGQYKIYSNSKKAIEMIIKAGKGSVPALGKADEMKYMRTIFPADPEKEDFFCYLSDPHIRSLVGPVSKIGRKRRIQCLNTLRMIQNAISFAKMEKFDKPLTIENLVKEGFLSKNYLVCQDGGKFAIREGDGEPFCNFHGFMRYFVPILDAPPEKVSSSEEAEYKSFVDDYSNYWSKFFDPVGIRGKIVPNGVILETCILPLIENSIYDGFRRFCGGDPVEMNFPTHPDTIFQLLGKMNFDELSKMSSEDLRYFDDIAAKTGVSGEEFISALGNSFSLNFVDSDPKFYLTWIEDGVISPRRFTSVIPLLVGSFFVSSLKLPTYAVIKLKNVSKIETCLREILEKVSVDDQINRRDRRFFPFSINTYTTTTEITPKIYLVEINLAIFKIRLFISIIDDCLIISSKRNIIHEIAANPSCRTKTKTNLEFRINFKTFKDFSREARLNWQEKVREVCLNNFGSLYALKKFRGIPETEWSQSSLSINGAIPFCPGGGKYYFDAITESIKCSVHGDRFLPMQPLEPDLSVPLNAFVNSMKGLRASLKFTSEGVLTKVVIETGATKDN